VLLGVTWFRSFSRNFERRRSENQTFERLSRPAAQGLKYAFARVKYRKTHRVYMCESCRNILKIPRAPGSVAAGKRIEIKCPKCGRAFIKPV
jgi:rubrerythrin